MPKATSELKSPWAIHVRSYMESNPGVSYREAQKLAKPSYQSAAKSKKAAPKTVKAKAAPRVKAPPKPKKPKVAPEAKVEKKESKTDHLQPWRAHIATYRAENPETSLKEVLKAAKTTYRTKGRGRRIRCVV